MADGVILNANTSTGATMATDDAGAAGHVQLMKLAISTDGSASLVPADGTNGIYVNVRNVNGSITVVGAAADGAAASGNPVLIAGFDGTNAQSISVTAGGVVHVHDAGGSLTVDGTVGVSGTVTVDGSGVTQPVSHAALTELAAAIDTEVQVDVVGSLPAGTNNIGDVDVLTLPSLPAGSNTIGAVNIAAAQTLATVTTVSTVTNLSQLGGTAVAMNTGTRSAGTQRVTVATDDVVQTAGTVAEDQVLSGNPIRNGARASTAIPSAMSADGDVVTLWADRNGALVVTQRPATTPTTANVSGSASSVTLFASNTAALARALINDSSATLYLKYGSTASATSFSYLVPPGGTWEMPYRYTGIITGIWTSATGAARTTELS